jgi:hypothetical protein
VEGAWSWPRGLPRGLVVGFSGGGGGEETRGSAPRWHLYRRAESVGELADRNPTHFAGDFLSDLEKGRLHLYGRVAHTSRGAGGGDSVGPRARARPAAAASAAASRVSSPLGDAGDARGREWAELLPRDARVMLGPRRVQSSYERNQRWEVNGGAAAVGELRDQNPSHYAGDLWRDLREDAAAVLPPLRFTLREGAAFGGGGTSCSGGGTGGAGGVADGSGGGTNGSASEASGAAGGPESGAGGQSSRGGGASGGPSGATGSHSGGAPLRRGTAAPRGEASRRRAGPAGRRERPADRQVGRPRRCVAARERGRGAPRKEWRGTSGAAPCRLPCGARWGRWPTPTS